MLFCIKFRTNHAWGHGRWEYVILERNKKEKMREAINDWAEGIHDSYSYSDKYRGVDWHHIRKPKPEIILKKISSVVSRAASLIEWSEQLTELLPEGD